jgi:hypothetical protein
MRNTPDVTGGKPIAVLLQSISGVSAINPLVTFYIHTYMCKNSNTNITYGNTTINVDGPAISALRRVIAEV